MAEGEGSNPANPIIDFFSRLQNRGQSAPGADGSNVTPNPTNRFGDINFGPNDLWWTGGGDPRQFFNSDLIEQTARNWMAWAPFREEQQTAIGNQRDSLMQALAAIQGGFGQARGQVKDIMSAQRTEAGDAATRTSARVSQDLASRGLGGTTISGNLQRGVEADRQRALERISGQEASIYAQLFPQQAAQEANIYGSLANIYGSNLDRSLQTYLTQFEHIGAPAGRGAMTGEDWGALALQGGLGLLGAFI